MIPVTCSANDLETPKAIVERIYGEVCNQDEGEKIPYLYGTMIES